MRFNGLEIRPPKKTDSVKAYLDFISELIDEDVFILINKKPTLKEQKNWLADKVNSLKNGREVSLCVWDGEVHVGNCHATRDRWKEDQNVFIGLAIRKKYRRHGLGEKLLRETIKLVKKKFRPKNIYLRVFQDNEPAKNLYRKVGFKTIATFPNWTLHKGKYVGHDWMVLKEDTK